MADTAPLAELSRSVPVKQEPFLCRKPGFIPSSVLCCSVVYPNPMHRGSSALQLNADTQFNQTPRGYRPGCFFLSLGRFFFSYCAGLTQFEKGDNRQ